MVIEIHKVLSKEQDTQSEAWNITELSKCSKIMKSG